LADLDHSTRTAVRECRIGAPEKILLVFPLLTRHSLARLRPNLDVRSVPIRHGTSGGFFVRTTVEGPGHGQAGQAQPSRV